MSRTGQYTLFTGDEGVYRLEQVNAIYNSGTQAFLTQNGITAAKKILIVGCGTGIMLTWIAKQAPDADIYAVDIDRQQVAIARNRVEASKCRNVTVIVCDGHELLNRFNDKRGYFDFTMTRFVLAHVRQGEDIFTQMVELTAKDGKLFCEEAVTSMHSCVPNNPDFDKYYDIWNRCRLSKGADPEFGSKLKDFYDKYGLTGCVTAHQSSELPVGSDTRQIFYLNMLEIWPHVQQAQIEEETEFNRIRDAMQQLADQSEYALKFSGSIQVCGIAPGPKLIPVSKKTI